MRLRKYNKYLGMLSLFSVAALVSGCSDMVLMNPKGQIGLEQRSLILTAFGLMLIVVIPAVVMAFVFAIKYRASNTKATYSPNWSHSSKVELVVWTVPILIIIFLATLTWKSTHALDPSKPIVSDAKPVTIQVVAMDWKWLFIYPEQGIATVNEIAFRQRTGEIRYYLQFGHEFLLYSPVGRPDLCHGRYECHPASHCQRAGQL